MAGFFLLYLFNSLLLAHCNLPFQKRQLEAYDSQSARYLSSTNFHRNLDQDVYSDEFDLADEDHIEMEPAVTLRLYGNTMMGYYYVTMFFGSPLQRQNLIVDTGSTITTIPCTECGAECGTKHFNKAFDTDKSHSHESFKCNERFNNYMCNDCENSCPFQIGYTEGSSYQGHFTKDYVVFGNDIEDHYFKKGYMNLEQINSTDNQITHLRPTSSISEPVPENETQMLPTQENDPEQQHIEKTIKKRRVFMPFGCTVKETKLFYYQEADGILGLGVYTNSLKLPPNIVDVYGNSKPGAFNAFSICFADEGGLFTVGGYNTSHHDPTDVVQYVPFYADSGQYRVHLNRIEFEGDDLGISEKSLNNGQGAFFDSGTTLAYAPSYTVKAIKESLNQYCAQSSDKCGGNRRRGTCWLYNPETNPTVEDFYESFGTFSFYFGEDGEKKYEWKAQDFLYQETAGSRWFCLGLEVFEDRTILGGTFMKNHDIMFDKRQKRIGFVRANCSTHIPEYISRMTLDKSSENLDNLIALVIIISIALTIYGLIRANRLWHNKNKYFFPLNLVENTKNFSFKFLRRSSSPKGTNKVTCFQ